MASLPMRRRPSARDHPLGTTKLWRGRRSRELVSGRFWLIHRSAFRELWILRREQCSDRRTEFHDGSGCSLQPWPEVLVRRSVHGA